MASDGENDLGSQLAEAERRIIETAIAHTGGNVTAAAAKLGVSRAGLYLKMDRLGLR